MNLLVSGAGGFGREVARMLSDFSTFEVQGFVDADQTLWGESVDDVPVLGGDEVLESRRVDFEGYGVALCVGDSQVRKLIHERVSRLGYALPPIVHPQAYVAPDVPVGSGTIIYPGAVAMTGCSLGHGVLVNAGATLGHDVRVGDFSNIGPGANIAGRVVLEAGVLVGIGSSILEMCTVGANARIGGGAVVIDDVPSAATVVGIPARPTT